MRNIYIYVYIFLFRVDARILMIDMIRKVNAWLPLGAVAGFETETGGRLCGYVCHMNTLVRNHFRTEEFVFVQPVSICINHKGNSFNENYMIQLL